MSKKCVTCGAELKDDELFCTSCGAAVEQPEPEKPAKKPRSRKTEKAAPAPVPATPEKVSEVAEKPEAAVEAAAEKAEIVVEAAEAVSQKVEKVAEPAQPVVVAAPVGAQPAVKGHAPNPVVHTEPQPVANAPLPPAPAKSKDDVPAALPRKYRPLKTSTFMWLSLLFAIPVIGLIAMIVCAIPNGINRNTRNMARAGLLWLLIGAFVLIIVALLGYLLVWPHYGLEITRAWNSILAIFN